MEDKKAASWDSGRPAAERIEQTLALDYIRHRWDNRISPTLCDGDASSLLPPSGEITFFVTADGPPDNWKVKGVPLARVLRCVLYMNNTKPQCEHTTEIIRLLERIVGRFTDEYRRPANEIALYEKYLRLRRSHDARLVRHLIVISGGREAKNGRPHCRAKNAGKSTAGKMTTFVSRGQLG